MRRRRPRACRAIAVCGRARGSRSRSACSLIVAGDRRSRSHPRASSGKSARHVRASRTAAVPALVGFVALAARHRPRCCKLEHGLVDAGPEQPGTRNALDARRVGFKSFVACRYLMARSSPRLAASSLFVALPRSCSSRVVSLRSCSSTLVDEGEPARRSIAGAAATTSRAATSGAKIARGRARCTSSLHRRRCCASCSRSSRRCRSSACGSAPARSSACSSVMSGFETDLRQKILGSNAHIQVTREDGDFTELARGQGEDRQDARASSRRRRTPSARSSIAANNNGMNVIIKGIDPDDGRQGDRARRRTSRTSDAMKRLEPHRRRRSHDLARPADPARAAARRSIRRRPTCPARGDPIDFSQPAAGSARTPARRAPPAPTIDDRIAVRRRPTSSRRQRHRQ